MFTPLQGPPRKADEPNSSDLSLAFCMSDLLPNHTVKCSDLTPQGTLTVSAPTAQELSNGLAGWSWHRVSHDVLVEMSAKAAVK